MNILPTVHVVVVSHTQMIDLSLPTNIPIRDVIEGIKPLLHTIEDSTTVDTLLKTQLTLSPIASPPFNPDATLDSVNVLDGDLLILNTIHNSFPAPSPIVEDISQYTTLTIEHSRSFLDTIKLTAPWIFLAVAFCSSVIVHYERFWRATSTPQLLFLELFTATLGVLLLLIGHNIHRRSTVLSSVYSLAGIIELSACIVWKNIDTPISHGAIIGSIFFLFLTTFIGIRYVVRLSALWIIVYVSALAGLITAVLRLEFSCSTAILSCILFIGFALPLSCSFTSKLSLLLAKIHIPLVPNATAKKVEIITHTHLDALGKKINLLQEYQSAFLICATLAQTVSIILLHPTRWWEWVLAASMIIATVIRSRIWGLQVHKMWLLSSVFITPIALSCAYLCAIPTVQILLLTSLLASVILFASLTIPPALSVENYPVLMRYTTIGIGYLLDIALIVIFILYITGLFSYVRHS